MSYLHSIGVSVPPYRISQQHHAKILETAPDMSREDHLKLKRIYGSSGVDFRYSVLDEFGFQDEGNHILFHPSNHHPSMPVSVRMKLFEKFSMELMNKAASDALDESGFSAGSVTHVITFSCTGLYAPGPDILLSEELHLNRNVERTAINFMGCYAAINALKTAYHISRSDNGAVILLCGIELCTLHYQRSFAPQQMVANALFGDGAAAAIVSASIPARRGLNMKSFYASYEPAGIDDMVWTIGNSGFNLWLGMEVPVKIQEGIAAFFEKLLLHANISRERIKHYAVHPGGVKILRAFHKALDIPESYSDISYDVLRNYGNMSSVTILFVLKAHLLKFEEEDRQSHLLACAFGPGLTFESMIAEVV